MAVPNPRPPHQNYIPQWIGPGPGLPNPCDNRLDHDRENRYPAPPTECTSVVPGAMNAVRHGWGLPGGPWPLPEYAQIPCPTHAPVVHNVCYHCWRITRDIQWYKMAVTRIVAQPPDPANETNHWRGFLTRLCLLCETRERYLIASRHPGAVVIGAIPPPPAVQARMQNYPWNTCTCLHDLNRPNNPGRLCTTHFKQNWATVRALLVQARKVRKRWLFETSAIVPPGGGPNVLMTLSQARRQRRMTLVPGHCLRSCRCGAEVNIGVPQVWQCMACEGIVEVNGTSMPPGHLIVVPPTPTQRINSASMGAPLAMLQPRSPAFF